MKKMCLVLLLSFVVVSVGFAGTIGSGYGKGYGQNYGNGNDKEVVVTNDLLDVFVTNQPIPEPVNFPKIVEYHLILFEKSSEFLTWQDWFAAFEELVKDEMSNDWVPYGNMIYDPIVIIQPMVKYE